MTRCYQYLERFSETELRCKVYHFDVVSTVHQEGENAFKVIHVHVIHLVRVILEIVRPTLLMSVNDIFSFSYFRFVRVFLFKIREM